MKHCEVHWGDGEDNKFYIAPCPSEGKFLAVDIGDQERVVFVICERHAEIARGMPKIWVVVELPEGAAIGVERGARECANY